MAELTSLLLNGVDVEDQLQRIQNLGIESGT